TCEQDGALDLRARNEEVVMAADEITTADAQRSVSRLGPDVRPHPSQGCGDPLHRSSRKAGIADEGAPEWRARQEPGQQSHRGPRVPAIERRVRATKARAALTLEFKRLFRRSLDVGVPRGTGRFHPGASVRCP